MPQDIKVGISADTGGAAKGVDALDRSAENLATTLGTVERAADGVDKKLEKVASTAKRVADATASIADIQRTLSKALGSPISEPDAHKFVSNFEKIRTGKTGGYGSQRVRGFNNFQSWWQGHSSTFSTPSNAAQHRSHIIARGMQGTSYAAANAPPAPASPPPPPPPGTPPVPKPPKPPPKPKPGPISRASSSAFGSALGIGTSLLGIAGIATTISGIMGMVGEGVGYAADEGGNLDTLKRRYGGRGIGYGDLQQDVRGAAAGMGISYTDSAQYAGQYAGASGSPDDHIGDHLRTAYGTSRSLGVDPGLGTQFFGTMDKLGVAKDDAGQRRLAALIADGIERGGFTAKADEVLRAVADYAGSAFRASLSTPNVGAYLAGLTSMTAHTPGLDPAGAAGIIGQANSAMTQGGAVGEASKNLAYAALAPGYGPAVAEGLWSGGLFGTPDSVFGTAGNRTMMGQWADDTGQATPSGSMTNLHGIRKMLDKQTAGMGRADGAMVRAKSIQGFFGLQTIQEALALDQMDENPEQLGGAQKLLGSVGVDMSKMTNFTGIGDIAKLAGATSLGEMRGQYADTMDRTDITQARKDGIKKLYDSGDVDETRKAMAKILAEQGQVATPGSDTRTALVDLKDTLTQVGGMLLEPLNKVREAVVAIASKYAPQEYKDKLLAETESKTNFTKKVGAASKTELTEDMSEDDAAYDAAKKAAGGKPFDINAITPQPEHSSWDWLHDTRHDIKHAGEDPELAGEYDRAMVRREHLTARYNADYGTNVPSYMPKAGDAHGVRINNPTNLRHWGDRPSDGGFSTFDTPEDGIAAAVKNLHAYRDKHHVDTLGGIVERWAPENDGNDPDNYKSFMRGKTGWKDGDKFDEDDPASLLKFLKPMIHMEEGADPYSDDTIMAGIKRGLGIQPSASDANGPRDSLLKKTTDVDLPSGGPLPPVEPGGGRLPGLKDSTAADLLPKKGTDTDPTPNSTPLPAGDPNGARERMQHDVRVSGSTDIVLRDSSGKQIGIATAPMVQMSSQPTPAGASGGW